LQILDTDNDVPPGELFDTQVYEPALSCSSSDAPPPPVQLRRDIDTSGWKIPAASQLLLKISMNT
jgi:hypothetical protein